MENVNAIMDSSFQRKVQEPRLTLLIAIVMIRVNAVFGFSVLTKFARAINIVDKIDILDMDNAIAKKDISGFLESSDLVVLMKHSFNGFLCECLVGFTRNVNGVFTKSNFVP